MKKILLSFLGCTLFFVTSAQSKKNTIAVNDKVKIDMVLITPDTFVRKNYYGDTLCDYSRICPVMGKRAYIGYDTIVLAPYYIASRGDAAAPGGLKAVKHLLGIRYFHQKINN